MRRPASTLLLAASAALLVACGSSSGGSTTAGSTDSTTPAASTSSSAGSASSSTAPSDAQSGVATSLDPCQLVTGSEASSLAGVSFGKGIEHTNSRNGKQCVYGANTKSVFTVELGQATSTAVASAEWTEAQAQAKALVKGQLPPGIHVTLDTSNVSGIGDRAATVHGSASFGGLAFGFSGVYVLKGATFFAFQDLSSAKAPPSISSMTAQARTTAGRVS